VGRSNTLEIIITASDQASRTLTSIIDKASGGFDALGRGMMRTGVAMTAATAPFAAALVSSIQSASQFEESMTNVQAVLGRTDAEMQTLSADVLAMGAAARAGPQATAEAFYDIVGGVADASTHLAILNAAIATSEAGNADLGATTNALIAIMNSYAFSAEEAGFASDVLTTVVGKGVGSMDEFAAALPAITGLAHSLGIGFDELGASMAFITTKGFSAAEASTQLKAMMTALINPNEAMIASLQELGYESGQVAIEELGLAGAFQALSAESPTFQDNMAGAVGSVEALNGVIALSDEGFQDFEQTFKDSSEGATEAARQIQMDSVAAQMDVLNSNVEALKITIGSALLPVINRLVRGIQPVIQSVIAWARENPELIAQIGQVVAVVGGLGIALTVAGGIITGIGAVLGLLLSPIGLIVGAVALLGLAFKTNFMGFGDFIRGLADDLGRLAGQIKDAFTDEGLAGVGQLLLDKLASGLSDIAGWVMEHVITPIVDAIKNIEWSEVPGQIEAILLKIGEAEIEIATWVWDNIGSPIVDAIKGIDWGEVGAAALNILQGIADGLGDLGLWLRTNLVYPLIEKLVTTDWGLIADAALDILAGIASGFIDLLAWVGEHISLPIINALLGADFSGLLETGAAILTGIAAAFLDLATWTLDNLIVPLGDAVVAGATTLYNSALELGGNILNGIVDALVSLPSTIIGLINDAIPNDVGFTVDMPDWAGGDQTIAVNFPDNPIPGAARGASTRRGQPFWVGERGPELFVPSMAGRILPNGDSMALAGGRGGGVYSLSGATINLYGVQDPRAMFDAIEQEAKRRNRQFAGVRA